MTGSTGSVDYEIRRLLLAPEPCPHLRRDLLTEPPGARAYCGAHKVFGLRTWRGVVVSAEPFPQAVYAPR